MLKDAFALHAQAKFAEDERAYAEILRRQPGHFQSLPLFGALAVKHGLQPRAVDIDELQQALLAQGVYLRPRTEVQAAQQKEQACA